MTKEHPAIKKLEQAFPGVVKKIITGFRGDRDHRG